MDRGIEASASRNQEAKSTWHQLACLQRTTQWGSWSIESWHTHSSVLASQGWCHRCRRSWMASCVRSQTAQEFDKLFALVRTLDRSRRLFGWSSRSRLHLHTGSSTARYQRLHCFSCGLHRTAWTPSLHQAQWANACSWTWWGMQAVWRELHLELMCWRMHHFWDTTPLPKLRLGSLQNAWCTAREEACSWSSRLLPVWMHISLPPAWIRFRSWGPQLPL